MVHQNGLRQDLTEDHIQHGTAGKTQAHGQTQRADLAQPVAQKAASMIFTALSFLMAENVQAAKNGIHTGKKPEGVVEYPKNSGRKEP